MCCKCNTPSYNAKSKYQKNANDLIGHFGLGFYSSFMVSSKVQIKTLSFKEGSKAVQWESNGDPTYELKEIKKKSRGTDIVLHIDKIYFLRRADILAFSKSLSVSYINIRYLNTAHFHICIYIKRAGHVH